MEPDLNVEWVQEAAQAYNEGKHLLISGQTGVGKSVLMRSLSAPNCASEVVWLPCSISGFEFSGLSHTTRLAVADDINTEYFKTHHQSLLRLLDGGTVSINPKCQGIRQFYCTSRFLFCSNFEGLLDDDPALKRRIHEVSANGVQGFREKTVQTGQTSSLQEEIFPEEEVSEI